MLEYCELCGKKLIKVDEFDRTIDFSDKKKKVTTTYAIYECPDYTGKAIAIYHSKEVVVVKRVTHG